jgi:hypothetical protein
MVIQVELASFHSFTWIGSYALVNLDTWSTGGNPQVPYIEMMICRPLSGTMVFKSGFSMASDIEIMIDLLMWEDI